MFSLARPVEARFWLVAAESILVVHLASPHALLLLPHHHLPALFSGFSLLDSVSPLLHGAFLTPSMI